MDYLQDIQTSNANGSTAEQSAYWQELCHRVNTREMTMNQAYKKAQEGWSNGDGQGIGGFIGSFNLWVENAVNNGWVQDGLTIGSGIQEQIQTQPPAPVVEEKKNNSGVIVGFVIAAILIGGAIYFYKKAKEKQG